MLGLSTLIVSCADHGGADDGVGSTTGANIPTYEEFKVGKYEPDCSVTYQAHVSELGWTTAVSDGAEAGTTGQGLGIEALRVQLSRSCF